jgi:alkanesulfonate monooxygenase SsuD/methylene tetrahydromethanopterin reductase-like flavin-dependent oxidoreductase (luciferase family)
VPIHIGGHSRAAARRAGRLGDGLQPLGVAGDGLSDLVSVMRAAAGDAGRDADALELSLGHLVTKVDAERAGRLAEAGADRLVLGMPSVTDIDEAREALSACAKRLGLHP